MSGNSQDAMADAIAKALGAVEGIAPLAWDAAVSAVFVRAITQVGFGAALLIVAWICGRKAARVLNGPDGDEPTAKLMFPAIVAFVGGLLGVLMVLGSYGVVALINPEGYLVMKALAGK